MNPVRRWDKVPELSLNQYVDGSATEQKEFTEDLFEGLKYFGFIILKDHPIDTKLLDNCYQLSQELFCLPAEEKTKYISKNHPSQRGYTPFGQEHAKDNPHPDLKEFWHVGQLLPKDNPKDNKFSYPENIWPEEIPEFETHLAQLYKKLDEVGKIILEALTPTLDLPKGYFTEMVTDGNSILRLLHYPPIAEGQDPHCIRAAAHEDINLITILVSASASGLELLDRDGKWLPVETDANNLIVDAGDMLSRICNDIIPSTTHRVVNPQDGKNCSRYSMPFFIHPHPQAMLKCIPSCVGEGAKYEDILSQDFLMQRLEEIGLK